MEEDHVVVSPSIRADVKIRADNANMPIVYCEGVATVAVNAETVKIVFSDDIPGVEGQPIQKAVVMLTMSRRSFKTVSKIFSDLSDSDEFADVKPLPLRVEEAPSG